MIYTIQFREPGGRWRDWALVKRPLKPAFPWSFVLDIWAKARWPRLRDYEVRAV